MTDEELQQMFAETARIRELANPAAVPYSDFQVPKSNAAPSSFGSNLGGLLFGGADSGLNEYLSRDQQKAMQQQALISAGISLLKNSGYTTRPIGFGEALGSAYEAGQQGYQGAQTNAINQLMTKQKLDEYKRQVADQEAYSNMFAQMPTAGAAMTPEQALSVGAGQAGPTPQRAAMIGMPMPAGTATTGGMPALNPMQRSILALHKRRSKNITIRADGTFLLLWVIKCCFRPETLASNPHCAENCYPSGSALSQSSKSSAMLHTSSPFHPM
jgi:hypothetical protein